MAGSVTGLHTFGPDTGPEALSLLDGNYSLLANSLNALSSFSNYYVDSSGAANAITVTVTAPQTFAYVAGIALQVKLANTNTATAVVINVNALGNKTVVLNDGAAPPVGSLTVGSILYLLFDGTNFQVIGQRATSTITTGLFGDGAAGAPSISFSLDPDTGMYRRLANTVSFSAGGTLAADITAASVRSIGTQGYIVDTDGSAATPAYSWTSDPDSGLFRAGPNDVRISVGGVANLQILAAQVASLVPYTTADGAVGAPAFSFFNDPNTGLYRIGADDLGITAGGTLIAEFVGGSGVGARFPIAIGLFDGAVGTPGMTFASDSDTGFYRDTANQIAIALGGSTAGQITQGSFTGTLTGCTTSPTATITWQRIGNHVMLRIPQALNAVSNAATLTITGMPAIIQPAATHDVPTCGLQDNSVNQDTTTTKLTARFTAASGTITFLRAGTASWTAAGQKGLFSDLVIVFWLGA